MALSSETTTTKHADGPDFAAIRRDIGTLRDDIASVTGAFTKDVGESLTTRGGRAAHAVGQRLEQRPLLTLAMVFAIGFAGGRLLHR